MSKLEFKPEDFNALYGDCPLTKMSIVKIANARLAEMLKDAPVVYFDDEASMNEKGTIDCATRKPRNKDTHRALLVNIEELPKEPCKHEPKRDWPHSPQYFCRHCGVKLVIRWEAEGE